MGYGKRRFRKKRKGRKKKTLRLSLAQARSKRVDNSAERIIKIIAKREAETAIAKSKVRLISRKFLFSTYDPVTNQHGGAVAMDYSGVVIPLSRLRQTDVEFIGAIQAQEIDESKQAESAEATGLGVGVIDTSSHNYRVGSFAKFEAFQLHLRSYMRRLVETNPSQAYDNAVLWWKLICVTASEIDGTDWRPNIEDVMVLRSWGFNSKLDLPEVVPHAACGVKYRTLCKGSMSFHPTTLAPVQKNFDRYYKFKRPVLVNYDPLSQTGEQSDKAIFLCMKSNIPVAFNDAKVSVSACTKLFYLDR